MEHFDFKFHKAAQPAFDDVPAPHRCCLMGVNYVHLKGMQGGDLYVTRFGWSSLACLMPDVWFVGEKFRKLGRLLAGATGAVYRIPVSHRTGRNIALVAKFSRAGQDIGITVIDKDLNLDDFENERIVDAEFLAPFSEFQAVHLLRSATSSLFRTKQPLAIYSPPTQYHDWKLGRKASLTDRLNYQLLASQTDIPENQRVTYKWDRLYILLYRWIDGIDAEQAALRGCINEQTMISLGRLARTSMRNSGWMVCDHKPRHVIVRPLAKGGVLRHHGQIVWALVDYELLVPIPKPLPVQLPYHVERGVP